MVVKEIQPKTPELAAAVQIDAHSHSEWDEGFGLEYNDRPGRVAKPV